MRRAMIACGGTGGHLSPGIALAEELVSRGWKCELIISNKQVDSRLVNKYSNFEYFSVPGAPLSLHPVRFGKFLFSLGAGVWKCAMHIRRERPDVAIGFGGFLSASTLLAGRMLGVPVAIHEANRIPGRVTRLVSLFASRLYLPQGVHVKAHSSRIRHVGMPVRSEIKLIPKQEAKVSLELNPHQKLLVIMGGSQGAKALTDWAKQNLENLANDEIQVLCLTGMQGGSDRSLVLKSRDGAEVKSRFVCFSDDMPTLLSAADMTISRSGAGSIAEIIRCRVPTILIPYPHAADNHQHFNASHFEMQGGGISLAQEDMGGLLKEVRDRMFSDCLLEKSRSNLEKMDRVNVQEYMASDLEDLIEDSGFMGKPRPSRSAIEETS